MSSIRKCVVSTNATAALRSALTGNRLGVPSQSTRAVRTRPPPHRSATAASCASRAEEPAAVVVRGAATATGPGHRAQCCSTSHSRSRDTANTSVKL